MTIDGSCAWSLLRALRGRCDEAAQHEVTTAPNGARRLVIAASEQTRLTAQPDGTWSSDAAVTPDARALLDLLAPLCVAGPSRPLTIAHLGQSLDGRIATEAGRSHYINGTQNLDHLHRLRALADAVVVGARTVEADDPRLTTRRVPGESPVRVVIDPARRLDGAHRLFSDAGRTWLIGGDGNERSAVPDEVEQIALPYRDGTVDPEAIVAALRARGCHLILVEGGGATVSRFLSAGALDRLHIAVAPIVIGSGRMGLTLPAIDSLGDAKRPTVRRFDQGADTLFDCAFHDG